MMEESRKRIFYLDYLRILATFSVVVLHVAAQNWYDTPIQSVEWAVYNAYNSSVRWAVPVFVMISGALFLDRNKTIHTKDIYFKSIFRMTTAYVFWAYLYSAGAIRAGQSLQATLNMIFGGYYHFWYMPMAMALYALVPVLRSFTTTDLSGQKTERYFLVLGFVLGFFFPRTVDFLSTLPLTNTLFFLPKLSELIARIDFRFGAGYVYYFVLGHYLSTREIKRGTRRLIYIMGIISVAGTIMLTQWYSNCSGEPSEKYYNNFSIPAHFAAVSVFIFSKYILSRIRVGVCAQKGIAFVSRCCFGIYLVHLWVLSNIEELLLWHAGTFNPMYNVFLLSLAVFGISFLISAVANKIPILSKYIV